jgi:DNA replication factor GINS
MDIVKLRELLEEELSKFELVSLSDDFYREYDSLIKALKLSAERSHERGEDLEERTYLAQLRIAEDLMREILKIRLHKIVDLAFEGKPEEMPSEERRIFRILRAFIEREELPGEEEEIPEERVEKPKEEVKPRVLSAYIVNEDLPTLLGPDMREYGPLKAGDLVTLPDEIGEVLLKRGVAVKIRFS